MVSTMRKLCTAALIRYRATGTRFLPEPDLAILLLHIHITLNTASEASLFIVINSLRPSDAYMRHLTKHHLFR